MSRSIAARSIKVTRFLNCASYLIVIPYFADLAKEVEVPEKGILSRTLYNDDRVKVVLFGFAAGEELSEHTAATPAMRNVN